MDAAHLGFGATFSSLATREGLIALDKRFLAKVPEQDPALHESLLAARAAPDVLDAKAESNLITSLGPILDAFVAELFGVEEQLDAIVAETKHLDPIHACKRLFVQRQAVKKYADPSGFDGAALRAALETLMGETLTEASFSNHVASWERDERKDAIDVALRYAAWATLTPEGRARHAGETLFRTPAKIDFQNLVPVTTVERNGVTMKCLPEHDWRARDGFACTDPGMNGQQALDQINYCIWCHNQGKDSCRKGLKDRKTGAWQKSPFGVTLTGCPLEEKISEMHTLRAQGNLIGAFATIAVDNPMVAATGHRICNDCMKACIYQKQEPVDIPQAETAILKDVLGLPWGFEIYSLLTRWNPLDIRRPLPRPTPGARCSSLARGRRGSHSPITS